MSVNKNSGDSGKQKHEESHRVVKRGDKYHCEVCNSEVPFKKACPTCQAIPDWARIKTEINPF
jgi:rubrerythrin